MSHDPPPTVEPTRRRYTIVTVGDTPGQAPSFVVEPGANSNQYDTNLQNVLSDEDGVLVFGSYGAGRSLFPVRNIARIIDEPAG